MLHGNGRLMLGQEDVPPDEQKSIEQIVNLSLADMNIHRRPVLRGQHPKSNGCLRATFQVEADVPVELRHGIFASPGSSFDALVRFSTHEMSDDSKPDTRGMAVKLLQGGETYQDFVMIDHPVFFVKNAADYVVLARTLIRAQRLKLLRNPFLPDWIKKAIKNGVLFVGFFWRHWREASIGIKLGSKPPRNLLDIRYWSATPYKLGPHAIKFSARRSGPPSTQSSLPPIQGDPCNMLRNLLRQDLASHGVIFDFLVQRQTDAYAMPVENPTKEWSETKSPFQRVATIHIPAQDPGSADDLCENLSFTPWHTQKEHQPLGGINRVRRKVYERVAQRRISLNEAG